MKGINAFVVSSHSKFSTLGSQGSLTVRSCGTWITSKDAGSSSFRTLRGYFLERAHSSFVGILLKAFSGRDSEHVNVVSGLTKVCPSPSQMSRGNHSSSGASRSCAPTTRPTSVLQRFCSNMPMQQQWPLPLTQRVYVPEA